MVRASSVETKRREIAYLKNQLAQALEREAQQKVRAEKAEALVHRIREVETDGPQILDDLNALWDRLDDFRDNPKKSMPLADQRELVEWWNELIGIVADLDTKNGDLEAERDEMKRQRDAIAERADERQKVLDEQIDALEAEIKRLKVLAAKPEAPSNVEGPEASSTIEGGSGS